MLIIYKTNSIIGAEEDFFLAMDKYRQEQGTRQQAYEKYYELLLAIRKDYRFLIELEKAEIVFDRDLVAYHARGCSAAAVEESHRQVLHLTYEASRRGGLEAALHYLDTLKRWPEYRETKNEKANPPLTSKREDEPCALSA